MKHLDEQTAVEFGLHVKRARWIKLMSPPPPPFLSGQAGVIPEKGPRNIASLYLLPNCFQHVQGYT